MLPMITEGIPALAPDFLPSPSTRDEFSVSGFDDPSAWHTDDSVSRLHVLHSCSYLEATASPSHRPSTAPIFDTTHKAIIDNIITVIHACHLYHTAHQCTISH